MNKGLVSRMVLHEQTGLREGKGVYVAGLGDVAMVILSVVSECLLIRWRCGHG